MNVREFFERATELERARVPFALATVVERDAPVSSHVGDRAIVFSDGRIRGFVGGSCSREIVRRHALDAMRSGDARLVQIRPGAPSETDSQTRSGTVVVPMSCASEGAVDVYIEPHLPARTLLIAGFTPVAGELARLGAMLDGYDVIRVVEQAELRELAGEESAHAVPLGGLRDFLAAMEAEDRARCVAIVASEGHYDDAALEALLEESEPAYVGLFASRKRAADVFAVARARRLERLARSRAQPRRFGHRRHTAR
jgi:xanthine dehydrogenase accessory factor